MPEEHPSVTRSCPPSSTEPQLSVSGHFHRFTDSPGNGRVSKATIVNPRTPGQQASDLGLFEPPIGIEPMTYSLRVRNEPSIAVRGGSGQARREPGDAVSSDRIRVAVSKLLAST